MKKLELKFAKEILNGQTHVFSTSDVLKVAIENVNKQQGLSISEMSLRIKIIDKLNEHQEFDLSKLKIEDIDFDLKKVIDIEDEYVVKLIEMMDVVEWKVVSRFVLSVLEDLKSQA
jgi:hypothetical protein